MPGRALVIGGVRIDHHSGLLGHSDADVLMHAITDAVLGAAGLGDIGRLFPDTDATFRDADSHDLLRQAMDLARSKGLEVGNVDATVIAQEPRLARHLAAMTDRISQALQCEAGQVNLKAKTNERLGYLGRSEGIEAQAVVLLIGAEPAAPLPPPHSSRGRGPAAGTGCRQQLLRSLILKAHARDQPAGSRVLQRQGAAGAPREARDHGEPEAGTTDAAALRVSPCKGPG